MFQIIALIVMGGFMLKLVDNTIANGITQIDTHLQTAFLKPPQSGN